MAAGRLMNGKVSIFIGGYSISGVHPKDIGSRNRFAGSIFYNTCYLGLHKLKSEKKN